MIVSCPKCRTLYRHQPSTRRVARCGTCHAEIALPQTRTYLLQTVSRATRSAIRAAPDSSPALALSGVPVVSEARSTGAWTSRARLDTPVASVKPWDDPAPSPFEGEEREIAPESEGEHRLEEIAGRARNTEVADDPTARNVLLGVGVGAIAGLAFSPGLFDASWLSWAVGGTMGGLAAALWSRAWGLRRA